MKTNLEYSFKLSFDEPIQEHRFSLRITPRTTSYYKILSFATNDELFHTHDGFGNILSFGEIKEPHSTFEIRSTAQLEFISEYIETSDDLPSSLFLFDTELTHKSHKYYEILKNINIHGTTPKEIANELVNWIFTYFAYERGITCADSTIDILLEYKKGVCQDFAHFMIAVLRNYKIPARYVSGFVSGEGESHAWVEYFDGEFWRGADPTHNILITNEPYVKIAHGRDAFDVSINKGVFLGIGGDHSMDIKAIIGNEQ